MILRLKKDDVTELHEVDSVRVFDDEVQAFRGDEAVIREEDGYWQVVEVITEQGFVVEVIGRMQRSESEE